jgi:dihydrofolate reductase
MPVSVFVGVSLDGFIARADGSFDFLPDDCEPHGFEEFIAGVDAIVMGRNTYDVVMKFPAWPYEQKRVVILSGGALEIPAALRKTVEHMSGAPREIIAKLAAAGARHLYVDGGITVQRFLREGLVDRITITRAPVLIGQGIPLFGSLPADVKLEHISTKTYRPGLVTSEYRVLRPA